VKINMMIKFLFQTYVTSSDKEFAAATIQAIGRCASSIEEITDACLNGLISLMSNRDGRLHHLSALYSLTATLHCFESQCHSHPWTNLHPLSQLYFSSNAENDKTQTIPQQCNHETSFEGK
jgi:vesicle coat complex subunit